MATCSICRRPAAAMPPYMDEHYCLFHFRRLLIKRLRKDLRLQQGFSPEKTCFMVDDGTPKTALAKELVIAAFGTVRFVDAASDAQQELTAHCLEEDVSQRFSLFLQKMPLQMSGIRPLRSLSIDDIRILLPAAPLDREPFLHPLLSSLERAQPQAIFAASRILRENAVGGKRKTKKE